MSNDALSQVLVTVLGIMIFFLCVLIVIFIALKIKERTKDKKRDERIKEDKKNNSKVNKKSVGVEYTKQSVMDFMEFEKIEDNMIVQKNGRRYLMVVECQGINYDLMSQMEKVAVEEGFQQFLNTLRHPVQIYIQTRTVNLENSINTYKTKVKNIENEYRQLVYQYNQMNTAGIYTKEDLDKQFFEVTKKRNLLEYAQDLLNNTERMSLNRNILNKKYYIIIPYFSEEASSGDKKYDYEEIKNMAFSELYTKAQSIIRTLTSCSINGKILSSEELVDLLYVAYNRDEAEILGVNKAIRYGYDELYSTAPDVYEKKIKALDEEIEKRAIAMANQTIAKVKSKTQQMAEEKESDLEKLIKKMAEVVLNENRQYVGEEVANAAIQEINKTKEGGVEEYEQTKTKTTRGRKKAAK